MISTNRAFLLRRKFRAREDGGDILQSFLGLAFLGRVVILPWPQIPKARIRQIAR